MNINYTQFTTNLTCSVIMPCFHSSNHAVETNMFALCRNVYDHSISYMCNIEYDQTSCTYYLPFVVFTLGISRIAMFSHMLLFVHEV